MKRLNENSRLAIVNSNLDVVGSVSYSEYLNASLDYRLFCVRVIAITSDKKIILVEQEDKNGNYYDTPYSVYMIYNETVDDTLQQIKDEIKSDIKFLVQHHYFDEKTDVVSRLYYVRQNLSDIKIDGNIKLYDLTINNNDVVLSNLIVSEIEFLKNNIYPLLDLDIRRDREE